MIGRLCNLTYLWYCRLRTPRVKGRRCDRQDMTNEEWIILPQLLPSEWPVRTRRDDRTVMNGIFFVHPTGIPWQDIPKRYGPCTTCEDRWSKNESRFVIHARLQSVGDEGDDRDGDGANALPTRMINSPAVRAHRHAAGSLAHGEPAQPGPSRGGMRIRIHAAVDGNAQPTALFLSPGQAADCTAAETLLADIEAGMTVIADKADDTNTNLDHLAEVGATAVIPSRSNRTEPRTLDTAGYATRNLVERFFERCKEFRRVSTRYEKRARNFQSAAMLAATRYPMRELARGTI